MREGRGENKVSGQRSWRGPRWSVIGFEGRNGADRRGWPSATESSSCNERRNGVTGINLMVKDRSHQARKRRFRRFDRHHQIAIAEEKLSTPGENAVLLVFDRNAGECLEPKRRETDHCQRLIIYKKNFEFRTS